MAVLPSQRFVIQQIDGRVILFGRDTEREIASFDPQDADAAARAQATIHFSAELSDEDKCFAHFWSGYFYAHADLGTAPEAQEPENPADPVAPR